MNTSGRRTFRLASAAQLTPPRVAHRRRTSTAYRLTPDVIERVVPVCAIGTYCLIRNGEIHYVGRSDTDLRRRLFAHYSVSRGEYFSFQLHATPEQAYVAECAAFHALRNQLTNIAHPAHPWDEAVACAFCSTEVRSIVAARRLARRSSRNLGIFESKKGEQP